MTIDLNYYARSLILNFDGTDAATATTDASQYAHATTWFGDAQLDTAQKAFGSASLLLDGTGDYIQQAHHAAFNFGASDFTIQWRIRFNALPAPSGIATIDGCYSGSSPTKVCWLLYVKNTAGVYSIEFDYSTDGATGVIGLVSTWTSPVAGVWYDVTCERSNGTLKLYVDGVAIGTTALSATIAAGSVDSPHRIGAYWAAGSATSFFNGWLDNGRITNGLAEYGGAASFTVPSIAHPEGVPTLTGQVNATLPTLAVAAYGGATLRSTLPMPTLAAYGGATAALTLPSLTLVARSGARVALSLPFLEISATGHDATGMNDADLTLPSFTVSARGGANGAVSLPSLTIAAAATNTGWGTASMSLPSLTIAATGKASAVGKANLTAPMFTMVGYSGAVLSVTLGSPTVAATGTAGAVGKMTATLPMFEIDATATARPHGSAVLTLPALRMADTGKAWLVLPGFTLTAIGTATVTATYEAYAVNLGHDNPKANDEVTRYTNFPFTQVVRYKGSYFGVGANGLYLLEGATDYAATPTNIPWAWKTGMDSFKSPTKKTVAAAYFRGRLGAAADVTLYPSEADGNEYSYQTPRDASPQNYRQKFGKGVKATHFAIGAAGDNELALDAIELEVIQLSRRI